MIENDEALRVTQERIAYFLQLRATCRSDAFPLVAGGYRAEVEQMQQDVLDYLTTDTAAATAG
jgi:hypothetical protein